MNLTELPPHIWAWSSAVIVAAIAAASGVIGHLFGGRKTKQDGLAILVENLQEEVKRLASRVEALEHDRNAYRSWSHVLWQHIHDESVPRKPAPQWPDELPR